MRTALLASLALVACNKTPPVAPAPPLEVLGQVPEFTLTDESGKPFGSADLRGRAWVADTFFTSCPSICPKLTKIMSTLQSRLAETKLEARLISISVDPDNDTPQVLKSYASLNGADPKRWTFLTGPMDTIRAVAVGGFQSHVGKPQRTGNVMDIAHLGKLVLVDGRGRVRGYFDADLEGVDAVLDALRQLVTEPAS